MSEIVISKQFLRDMTNHYEQVAAMNPKSNNAAQMRDAAVAIEKDILANSRPLNAIKQEIIEIIGDGYWTFNKELEQEIADGYIIDTVVYYSNGTGIAVVHKPE